MNWPTKKLSAVTQINPRRVSIERGDSVSTSFVPMEAVDEILGEISQAVTQPYSKVKKGYTYFENGDVIFAKITPCMQNGKHAVVNNLIDGFGFGSTEFHVIRASEQIVPEWIHYYLRRKQTLDAALKTFTGSVGQQRVPSTFLEDLDIPVPDPNLQRQIAARLKSQLAEVETARQAAQVQLREARLLSTKIVDSMFNQFDEWQPIGEVAKVQSGYAFKSESFKPSGIRLLRNANILPGKIYWDDVVYIDPNDASRYQSYVLKERDILISLDRPLISSGIKVARVGKSDLPALLLQRVGRFLLEPTEIDADFLYAFLQSSRFIDAISGHDQSLGVPHISPGQVEAIEIPILPLDEQRCIATQLRQRLAEADTLRTALEQQLRDLDALPQRILAKAFDT
ncbi:restriction endonuclease subunit S [Herbaspirillum sp. DW155]|uniref:restriction endonuclease subunit S n=1 Tax=Herbaspirillum sp. DW155 TaxID=3095609 RepID=UPI00308D5DC2|nr:restriction endonuclease subunit S [Herbaspirillum sp. DW155]